MLIRVTLWAGALLLLAACCRRQTVVSDAALVGKWHALNSSEVVVFDADHTLAWGFEDGNSDGTWTIADGVLAVAFREQGSTEKPHVFGKPKICGEKLFLDSRVYERVQ
jgi:hypothetical protein